METRTTLAALLPGLLPWPVPVGVVWRAAARPGGDPLRFASRADFALRRPRPVDPTAWGAEAIPYCYQARRRALLYTLHDDVAPVLAERFLFRAQRENARRVLEIRLADLPARLRARGRASAEPAPLFLISPGRAGSTLAGLLVRAAGYTALLEPDLYTGLGQARPDAAATRVLIRTATAALCRACGTDQPLIKLRAQAAPLWDALADALPAARLAVLLRRDQTAWARSTHRTFGTDAAAMAETWTAATRAAEGIARAGGGSAATIFYEDLIADPEAALTALGLPPRAGSGAAIASVMAADAQAGTPLERLGLAPRPTETQTLARFQELRIYSGSLPSPPGRSQT